MPLGYLLGKAAGKVAGKAVDKVVENKEAIGEAVRKAVGDINNMGNEMQTCVRAVEMANLSDGELMKYVNDYSSMIGFFRGSDAEDINATFKKLAVKRVASDRGLI